jgi:TPR repeat protein
VEVMTEPALRFLSLGIDLTKEEESVLAKIHAALDRLAQGRKTHLSISSSPLEEVLREVLQYRVVATASGTIVNWNTGNVLCSFLAARAFFETFAFLWDYDRAIAKFRQKGTLQEFKTITLNRLAATRNPNWVAIHPEWESTNILTLIDKLSSEYTAGVRKAYDEMSYRCHPNTEGMFYMFTDLDPDAEIVKFSDHNQNAGWAFRLVIAVAGLIIEAENIFNRLEEATPKIAAEIRSRSFKQIVAKAEGDDKKFTQFVKEEEKALQGHAGGQFNVGNSYAIGFAMVPKNLVLAHMWFSLAAAQGNEEAVKSRDMIARKMTPAQIAEAQALASEWKPITAEQFAEIDKYWRDYWRERKPEPPDWS